MVEENRDYVLDACIGWTLKKVMLKTNYSVKSVKKLVLVMLVDNYYYVANTITYMIIDILKKQTMMLKIKISDAKKNI